MSKSPKNKHYLGISNVEHISGVDENYTRFCWYRDNEDKIRLTFTYGLATIKFDK